MTTPQQPPQPTRRYCKVCESWRLLADFYSPLNNLTTICQPCIQNRTKYKTNTTFQQMKIPWDNIHR